MQIVDNVRSYRSLSEVIGIIQEDAGKNKWRYSDCLHVHMFLAVKQSKSSDVYSDETLFK